jgi:ABC-type transport system substrate-binding protein
VNVSGGAGAGNVQSALLIQDPYDNLEIVGDTIERWEFNQDNTKLTLHVRPGVKWHDGTPFTADDVVYTLNFYRDPPSPYAIGAERVLLNAVVSDVVKVENDTVDLNLKQLTASFLNEFAGRNIIVRPAHLTLEETSKRAMGAGPFKLKTFDRDISVEYERNPDYYLKDDKGRQLPYLDGIRGFAFNDQTLLLSALRTGRIKHTDSNNSAAIERGLDLIRRDVPDIVYDEFLGGSFGPNFKNIPPFSDPRVLEAIDLFFDRKLFVDLGFNGNGWPWGTGLVLYPNLFGGRWGLPDEEIMSRPGYRLLDASGKLVTDPREARAKWNELTKDPADIARARELLQQAGINQGDVKFEILSGRVSNTRTTPVLLGVMKDLFGAVWTSRFLASNAELALERQGGRWSVDNGGALGGFSVDEPSVDSWTWGSSSDTNPKFGGWPEELPVLVRIQELFEKQQFTFDVQKRKALIQDLQRAALDFRPKMFTNYSIGIVSWWPEFRNIMDVPAATRHHFMQRYDRVWIAK